MQKVNKSISMTVTNSSLRCLGHCYVITKRTLILEGERGPHEEGSCRDWDLVYRTYGRTCVLSFGLVYSIPYHSNTEVRE